MFSVSSLVETLPDPEMPYDEISNIFGPEILFPKIHELVREGYDFEEKSLDICTDYLKMFNARLIAMTLPFLKSRGTRAVEYYQNAQLLLSNTAENEITEEIRNEAEKMIEDAYHDTEDIIFCSLWSSASAVAMGFVDYGYWAIKVEKDEIPDQLPRWQFPECEISAEERDIRICRKPLCDEYANMDEMYISFRDDLKNDRIVRVSDLRQEDFYKLIAESEEPKRISK